jgi:hypothetical protein
MEESEFDVIAPCPVVGCSNSSSSKKFNWKHYDCNGKTKISKEGYIRCSRCRESADIVDWLFKCDQHDFKPLSRQGILLAVNIMVQSQNIPSKWQTDIMKKILAQQMRN